MAKFLDKKQRVIDFQLTPYGKHRLSLGRLKPVYYAFFDTGILYDSEYAGFKEGQTKIHERIKDETQYIEGILSFDEAENTVPESEWIGAVEKTPSVIDPASGAEYHEDFMWALFGAIKFAPSLDPRIRDSKHLFDMTWKTLAPAMGWEYSPGYSTSLFDLDVTPSMHVPKPNILSFESSIGDARFEGNNTQAAPAWKLLTCQGEISSIKEKDTSLYDFTGADFDKEINEINIPQIDIIANYTLEISPPSPFMSEEVPSDFYAETSLFADGNTIKLKKNDVVLYAEEVNTELLTENFEVEVYEMIEDVGQIVYAAGSLELGPTLLSGPTFDGDGKVTAIGDTLTLRDGINIVTFEIIDDSDAEIARAKAFGPNRVGVIKSNGYKLDGSFQNRKGTMWNLMSAILQDDGNADKGYPTNYNQGTDGDGSPNSSGRCLASDAPVGCFVGNHNLQIDFYGNEYLTRKGLIEHAFGSVDAYRIELRNLNNIQGDPNQTITTTAASYPAGDASRASSRIYPSGFLGGIVSKGTQLKRKYFIDTVEQVQDGFMISATEGEIPKPTLTEDSVEYYFNILTDKQVDGKIACSCASVFNRDSYYIDIDFDCVDDIDEMERIYYDIYGSATAPEVCDFTSAALETPYSQMAGGPGGAGADDDDNCEDE